MTGPHTFSGVLTALVTPFSADGVDEAAFRALVRRQLDAGVHGLVPCGTTGESPTLTGAEQHDVVRWTIEEAAGQVPVMAGIGSNNTAAAIANAIAFEKLGVQGVLATCPYYNKPTPEGLRLHFTAIANAVDTEVCIYDIPGRSAVKIPNGVIADLCALPNVRSVKDATGDMVNTTDLRARVGDRLALLSGDDLTLLPFWALGGDGCISVLSNLVPQRVVRLHALYAAGKLDDARAEVLAIHPLAQALFCETNPIPVKAAMAHLGLCDARLRLPLSPLGEAGTATLTAAMQNAGLV